MYGSDRWMVGSPSGLRYVPSGRSSRRLSALKTLPESSPCKSSSRRINDGNRLSPIRAQTKLEPVWRTSTRELTVFEAQNLVLFEIYGGNQVRSSTIIN